VKTKQTYVNAVDTVSELALEPSILRSQLAGVDLIVSVLHFGNRNVVIIIVVIAVVCYVPIALLPGLSPVRRVCRLVAEGRKPNRTPGLQWSEIREVKLARPTLG
jgi:hypothetical protein